MHLPCNGIRIIRDVSDFHHIRVPGYHDASMAFIFFSFNFGYDPKVYKGNSSEKRCLVSKTIQGCGGGKVWVYFIE
jgi:hypothetical protein